jgi:hypothetical protein
VRSTLHWVKQFKRIKYIWRIGTLNSEKAYIAYCEPYAEIAEICGAPEAAKALVLRHMKSHSIDSVRVARPYAAYGADTLTSELWHVSSGVSASPLCMVSIISPSKAYAALEPAIERMGLAEKDVKGKAALLRRLLGSPGQPFHPSAQWMPYAEQNPSATSAARIPDVVSAERIPDAVSAGEQSVAVNTEQNLDTASAGQHPDAVNAEQNPSAMQQAHFQSRSKRSLFTPLQPQLPPLQPQPPQSAQPQLQPPQFQPPQPQQPQQQPPPPLPQPPFPQYFPRPLVLWISNADNV